MRHLDAEMFRLSAVVVLLRSFNHTEPLSTQKREHCTIVNRSGGLGLGPQRMKKLHLSTMAAQTVVKASSRRVSPPWIVIFIATFFHLT